MPDSITIIDNRSGESVEIPIVDGGIDSGPWTKLLPGIWFKDEGFAATAVTNSSITYIDGGAGQLEYRGYPIEALAEHASFLEVAYLLLNGELPNRDQLDSWEETIASQSELDPDHNGPLLQAFQSQSHPMGMLTAGLAAMSTIYPDAREIEDPEVRAIHTINLIAKIPRLQLLRRVSEMGNPYSPHNLDLVTLKTFLLWSMGMAQPTTFRILLLPKL